MNDGLERQIRQWDGMAVVSRFDAPTESWCFIALHDDTLGPATGGTRIKVYRSPGDGLEDAQRLAEGMTNKWAAIDLPFGGGKAVLALSRELSGDERVGLLERFARLLNSLRGTFSTGQDLGATLDSETIPRLRCRIVAGSANNQLAVPEDAERLHRRAILYAPDYVINGGGALGFGLRNLGETDEEKILERISGLHATLREIFEEAHRRSESPVHAARRRIRRVLAGSPKSGADSRHPLS